MSEEYRDTTPSRVRFRWPRKGAKQRATQDDSAVPPRSSNRFRPPESRQLSKDDSDLALLSEKERAPQTSSRLPRFGFRSSTNNKRKKGRKLDNLAAADESIPLSDIGDSTPKSVTFGHADSFDSEISMPEQLRNYSSFDGSRNGARNDPPPVLKREHSKPQLMFDPTTMPFGTTGTSSKLIFDPTQMAYDPKMLENLKAHSARFNGVSNGNSSIASPRAAAALSPRAARTPAPEPAVHSSPALAKPPPRNDGSESSYQYESSSVSYSDSDMPAFAEPAPMAKPPPVRPGARGQRARYSVYQGTGWTGTRKPKFRVRPYHRFPDARTMTEEQIYADSLRPSNAFEQIKSYLAPTSKSASTVPAAPAVEKLFGSPQQDGRIGALRVEVLGCISLNRTKPDVGVYLVCGDTAFCTDVITGYRSPMWPCESRRAAVFPIHHAYAQLFVGVFDIRKNTDSDVFCGRVVFDIASIRPDTEYDVTMPLRYSKFVYDRRKRGVIRLRFSIHWFSEKAAVVSYFKSAKSLSKSSPFVEGHPTIPCADPKTFRNVAITVYGHDLPGKYSKNAFRATMREFNLYQLNFRLALQYMALDAVLYERWWISLYLWVTGMYAVSTSALWLIPPFFVGYLLILFWENYRCYVRDPKYNLGYKPITLEEISNALMDKPKAEEPIFQPITIEKKTKRRKGDAAKPTKSSASDDDDGGNNSDHEEEIPLLDHREFPFSERLAYPKMSVEKALAPSQSSKSSAGNSRLHGRLSVYYHTTDPQPDSVANLGTDDDDSGSDSSADRDDETIMAEGDGVFNLDSDNEEEEEENDDESANFALDKPQNILQTALGRVRAKPPQDSDVRGRKVPPQLMLQKIEKMVHKVSMKLSVEMVSAPVAQDCNTEASRISLESSDTVQLQAEAAKKKKAVYDAFDRLLGLETKSANPIQRMASSFLGPLMRVLRVAVFVVRIFFHISTWRDPYLSFWAFVFMVGLLLVLLIFPWKKFFLLVIMACVGPQNIFLRKYLEKKAEEKANEPDQSESLEDEKKEEVPLLPSTSGPPSSTDTLNESVHSQQIRADLRRRWPFGGTKASRSRVNSGEASSSSLGISRSPSSENIVESDRPAFRTELRGQTVPSRRVNPRSVAVPYSRLKKDRFFDWPPDPTVSRATPMPFREPQVLSTAAIGRPRLSTSGPRNLPLPTERRADVPRGLRRRQIEEQIRAKYGYSD